MEMARCVRNGDSIENNFDIVDAARKSCTGQSKHCFMDYPDHTCGSPRSAMFRATIEIEDTAFNCRTEKRAAGR